MTSIAFLHKAGGSIVVFVDGKPYTVDSTAINYKPVIEALENSDHETLVSLLNIRKAIADYTNGLVEVFGEDLYYDKKLVSNKLAERIVEMLRSNMLIEPYIRFMEKVQSNPLESSKEELFLFMESNNLPITPDGDFLAYKAITRSSDPNLDWTDSYTNTLVNKIGHVVEMPRSEVNSDRTETCSHGLHVCAYSYLKNHYNNNMHRLVAVKVNPKDVVSIPNDYHNAKMRVCRYLVVDEVIGWEDSIPKNYTEDYVSYDDEYAYYSDDEEEDDEDGFFDDSVDDLNTYNETELEGRSKPYAPETPSYAKKLDINAVRRIRALLEDEWSLAGIARQFSISARQVARIRDGESWNDVD